MYDASQSCKIEVDSIEREAGSRSIGLEQCVCLGTTRHFSLSSPLPCCTEEHLQVPFNHHLCANKASSQLFAFHRPSSTDDTRFCRNPL